MRHHILPQLLTALTALLGLTACGVQFSSTFDGTEMFKAIHLAGDMRPGADLTVTVKLNPAYPVPVEIACFYEDDDTLSEDQQKLAFHDRGILAGRTVIEAGRNTRPGDEVEPRDVSFTFKVERPGDYFIACLTPAAPDNGLGKSFEIAQP